jgi:hypothetical protein
MYIFVKIKLYIVPGEPSFLLFIMNTITPIINRIAIADPTPAPAPIMTD